MPTTDPVTTVTVGGVTAEIYFDGYAKGISLGQGPWRTIIYLCAWDDSDTFMDALMGGSPTSSGVPGGPVNFPKPHQYPGNKNLHCLEVDAKPLGASQPAPAGTNGLGIADPTTSKLFASDKALVTAKYGVSPFDVQGDEPDVSFGGVPVPWAHDNIRGYFHTYAIPKAVDAAGVSSFEIQVPHQEWVRRRMMVPELYTGVLDSLVGTVNNNVYWGRARGTFLFQPYEINRETQTDGGKMIELTMSWLWRPYDWNKRPAGDAPIRWIFFTDGTNYPYAYADHSPLIGV